MSVQAETYSFDGLPIADVADGTNVLLTGPGLGGVRDLLLRMLLRQHPREGVAIVAADVGARRALDEYADLGGDLDPARVGAVDCAGDAEPERNVSAVASPGDLTGVGIEFSSLYERLAEHGATRVRTGVYTLSPFLLYADATAVYRFVHTLTARIRTAGGLGVCAIDPATLDQETLSSLAQAFDGRVSLRQTDDGPEVRVRGLSGQDDGWQSVSLSE